MKYIFLLALMTLSYSAYADERYSGEKKVSLNGERQTLYPNALKKFILPYNYIGEFYRDKPYNFLALYIATAEYPDFNAGYPKFSEGKLTYEKNRVSIGFSHMSYDFNNDSATNNKAELLTRVALIVEEYPNQTEKHGLKHHDLETVSYYHNLNKFTGVDDFIFCNKFGNYPPTRNDPKYKTCTHTFMDEETGLAYEVGYHSELLHDWKTIKEKSIKLINSFAIR